MAQIQKIDDWNDSFIVVMQGLADLRFVLYLRYSVLYYWHVIPRNRA